MFRLACPRCWARQQPLSTSLALARSVSSSSGTSLGGSIRSGQWPGPLPQPGLTRSASRSYRSNSASPSQRRGIRTSSCALASIHTGMRMPTVIVESAHDPQTGTWQYIVADPSTLKAAIIDPVLDFDSTTQTISTETADRLLSLIDVKGYEVVRILETHVHADHLTAASYLQRVLEGKQAIRPSVCIGKRIYPVQQMFGRRYGVTEDELKRAFDKLLDDDETFQIGELQAKAIHLPGHTPDHVGYMIADNVFCGDSLFNADLGTARCDFPGGCARALYQSTRKLLSLPDYFRIWTGHDYPTTNRQCPVPYMSVAEQRQRNSYLQENVSEQSFQDMRNKRDASLSEPKLLHPALQINIRGGRLPRFTVRDQRYITLPLKLTNEPW